MLAAMKALVLSSLVLLTSACGSRGCKKEPDATVIAEPDARARAAADDAAAQGAVIPADLAAARGAKRVAFADDGALIVELRGRLVAIASNGEKRDITFAPDAFVS